MYKVTVKALVTGTFVALKESDGFIEIEPVENVGGDWTTVSSRIGRVSVTKPYNRFDSDLPAFVSTSSTGDMNAAEVITFVSILNLANEIANEINIPSSVHVDH